MTNSISIYNFNQNQIRTETIDGNPWFCLLDCCKALGIKNAATSVKLSEAGVGKTYCRYDSGRKEITIINEPNLYRLIFRSNKPQAQEFADWVYSEVLPTIRKTGSYTQPTQASLPLTYDITQDKHAMNAIGGMIKKCCATAIKDTLFNENESHENIKNALATIIEFGIATRVTKEVEDIKRSIANDLSKYY